MKQLMQKLLLIREDRGMTCADIERALGIDANTLREAENGETQLSIGELDKLLAYYRVTPDQALRYRRVNKRLLVILAAPLVILLIFAVVLAVANGSGQSPAEVVVSDADALGDDSSSAASGRTSETADDDGRTNANLGDMSSEGLIDQDAEASGEGGASVAQPEHEPEPGPGRADDNASGSDETVAKTQQPATSPPASVPQEQTVFRFWGNIVYDAATLPELPDNDDSHVRHVIPVERLTNSRPAWLQEEDANNRFILNVGTADIWTESTIAAWRELREDGIPVIGLGQTPEVYEPHIIQTAGRKIGFLSLAGLIHEPSHIAYPQRVGLPRAYDNEEVRKAVEQAKAQVDDLVVLIHWGVLSGDAQPIAKQLRLAGVIEQAGGDLIIGNRSRRSQQAAAINGVPIFYSLGRSAAQGMADGLHNYVIDAHFNAEGIEKLIVHEGVTSGGMLTFDPAFSPSQRLADELAKLREEVVAIPLELADGPES